MAKILFAMLNKALLQNGIALTQEMKEQLILYLELIKNWNRVFNLTTLTNNEEMVYLHIIDSLIITPYLHGKEILDVGSGAGLPGIPLALTNPSLHFTLLDKNNKKTRFLTQTVAELCLKNVKIIHERAEDFHASFCFDSILSRAYGSLRFFIESTEHLLCQDGLFIAMKGKYPQEEINDIPNGFKVENIASLAIKGKNIERHVVCLKTQR